MNPYRTGKLVLFQVSYDRGWHYFEIPMFILIGIFGVRHRAFLDHFPSSSELITLAGSAGSLWSLCRQVQPPGRIFPAQASLWPRHH